MTARQPDPWVLHTDAVERHRACTAPDLTPEQFRIAVRFETTPAECLCGRCDGRGRLRIDTAGVEHWTPCAGPSGYLANRDRWRA